MNDGNPKIDGGMMLEVKLLVGIRKQHEEVFKDKLAQFLSRMKSAYGISVRSKIDKPRQGKAVASWMMLGGTSN